MGLAWFLPDGVSFEKFFNLYHQTNQVLVEKPSLTEIVDEEKALTSVSIDRTNSAMQLIKFRELEKDYELDDLAVITSEIFKPLSHIDCPHGDDILPDLILEMGSRIFEIRSRIIEMLEE